MTVRRLDPETGGIVTRGRQFATGVDDVSQTIITRLRLYRSEYARDITEGTPWFQKILKKGISNSERNALIKNRIIRTPGVIEIMSFNVQFDLNERKYSIAAVVKTRYGDVTITEVV